MTKFFTYPTAVLAGLALLGSTQHADAQQFSKRKQYTSIGVSLNAMNYFGDLNPLTNFASVHLGDTRPNIGLNITHRFFPRVSGRFAVAYGRITADDNTNANKDDGNARYRYTRNMNFRNDIYEASAVVIVDLIENRNNYLKRPDFVPYVFGGVAGFHHSPEGKDANGNYVDLQPLKTEGVDYSKFQFAIPFGLGVRYRINRNLDAAFEIGFRKTFTGYLDDVSGKYADLSKATVPAQYFGGWGGGNAPGGITNTSTGVAGGFHPDLMNPANSAKRGQGKSDWYTVTGFSLNYILNPKIKNPKFR
ncbi:hypothetical protein GCM10023172_21750 [Hymenobacter ginsengisoli]|uniref:DUF6089 domain-containing protein n=1 Tax=Hymenobacter ginsengisoli TaxID=1051626 RepID=A0ABP8QG49_9BACT|nr:MULTISPECIES: DUF6089 family protein [unclassified Hymenobacter]MBO2032059.1 hypothetical protein [Hymenobacter sp. BT559]